MSHHQSILVVEDDLKERRALREALESWGYLVTSSHDGTDAAKKIENNRFQLVISNFEIPGLSSLDLLEVARAQNEIPQVLFLSNKVSVENAVESLKAGARDFIIKPADQDQIRHLVKSIINENGDKNDAEADKPAASSIVTQDEAMLRLLDMARQVADSKAAVLIQGESGTGKELFARFIHTHSSRRRNPFCAVNCGALPESLLESELFGHEKGAFTGAVASKPGKFELADRGTLLLDEITEMKVHLQSKLLRVLQEREIDRVGGLRPIGVDVRVVATTNRAMKTTIEKGAFREDLFYRLNVIPIKIPPLRERKHDIPLLTQHFIEKYNKIDGRNVNSLTSAAIDTLLDFPFKGNVRELENVIERAVLLSEGDMIDVKDLFLDDDVCRVQTNPSPQEALPEHLMTGPLKEIEKRVIFHTLDKTNGNRTHAAKSLGISVRTLRNKLNEYKAEK